MFPYPFITYLSLVATMFLWGGTFIAGRILGTSMEPSVAAFLRFAVASVTLVFFLRIRHGHIPKPQKKNILPLIFLGLTGIFSYNIFFFKGLQYIDAGRAALIIAANPVVIALCAAFFFKEKLTRTKICGVLLSFMSVIYVISNGHLAEILSGNFGVGEQAILYCVASWTAYTLAGRKILTSMAPLTAVTFSCVFGTLFLFVPALQNGLLETVVHLNTQDILAIIYLGVGGTALGFWWYYEAIKKIGASKSAIFINLVPVFALLLSHFLLGETVKISVLIGGLFTLIGVTLTNKKQ